MKEAKKYYPLFGLGANVALIFSGLYVRYVSGLRRASQVFSINECILFVRLCSTTCCIMPVGRASQAAAATVAATGAARAAIDPWGQSLRLLMGAVVASGLAIIGCFRYIETQAL